MKRIFVGGLSSDSTEDDLENYFEEFGKVNIDSGQDKFKKILLQIINENVHAQRCILIYVNTKIFQWNVRKFPSTF